MNTGNGHSATNAARACVSKSSVAAKIPSRISSASGVSAATQLIAPTAAAVMATKRRRLRNAR